MPEVNALHAEAFETRVFDESEWNWAELVRRNLGWVLARDSADLVGSSTCCGTAWCTPGCKTSWSPAGPGLGIGAELVRQSRVGAKAAGLRVSARGLRRPSEQLLLRRLRLHPPATGLITLA
jgi:hypothetical protein